MSNPETKLQKEILDYLHFRNIFAWRNNSGALKIGKRIINLSPAGSPDIIGIMSDGKFLGIEVKMPYATLTDQQRKFMKRLNDNHAFVFTVHSIHDVERNLKQYREQYDSQLR